jgi:hypothetical protein
MKKSIFIAVLGLAAIGATSSYAQGYVVFTSYASNGGNGNTTSLFGGGGLIGVGYTASLYFALGTVSDPVNESNPNSITSAPTGLTLLGGLTAAYDNSGAAIGAPGLGFFDGGVATIPGYSSGPVTFELWASNANGTVVGRSGSWTETSIINSASLPAGYFGDNGVAPNFLVAPVPEPTTLALAGLGGLASLVAFRRKQA